MFKGFAFNEFNGLRVESDVEMLIQDLNLNDPVWQSAGCMLLIEVGVIMLTLIVIKLNAESEKFR